MIKRFLFGQYKYKKSLIHSLDPRFKILYVIVLSILALTAEKFYEITLFSIFVLIIIFLAKIDFRGLVRNLRPFGSER